jgi:hypothetical protein
VHDLLRVKLPLRAVVIVARSEELEFTNGVVGTTLPAVPRWLIVMLIMDPGAQSEH